MLLWDGPARQGEAGPAGETARRFCRLCETSGMAETSDALTGAGLRDRPFAWISAVYLWFMASLQSEGASGGGGQ